MIADESSHAERKNQVSSLDDFLHILEYVHTILAPIKVLTPKVKNIKMLPIIEFLKPLSKLTAQSL